MNASPSLCPVSLRKPKEWIFPDLSLSSEEIRQPNSTSHSKPEPAFLARRRRVSEWPRGRDGADLGGGSADGPRSAAPAALPRPVRLPGSALAPPWACAPDADTAREQRHRRSCTYMQRRTVHADTCVHRQTCECSALFSADVSLSDGPQVWCASRVEGEGLVFLSHYTD